MTEFPVISEQMKKDMDALLRDESIPLTYGTFYFRDTKHRANLVDCGCPLTELGIRYADVDRQEMISDVEDKVDKILMPTLLKHYSDQSEERPYPPHEMTLDAFIRRYDKTVTSSYHSTPSMNVPMDIRRHVADNLVVEED